MKATHQSFVTLGSVEIPRGSDGNFKCPQHGSKGRTPQFVRKHRRCFQQENDSETVVGYPSNISTNHETANLNPVLQRFNLGYDSQRGYIYCQLCRGILSRSFEHHLRKVHRLSISLQEAETIRSTYLINSFSIDYEVLQAPLSYLTSHVGYVCSECKWKGLTRKSLDEHLKKSASCNSYEECRLQSADIGSSKKYFQVFEPDHEVSAVEEEDDFQQLIYNSTAVLRSLIRPAEDFRTRRQFYTDHGWFVDHEESRIIFDNDMLEFTNCPELLSSNESQIVDWIRECVDSVIGWDVFFRKKLSSEDHDFRYLETDGSRAAYTRKMIESVYFAINLVESPRGEVDFFYAPSRFVKNAVEVFLEEPTKNSLNI